jgi:ABC-type polysaccharide/polyol phosphate export permease
MIPIFFAAAGLGLLVSIINVVASDLGNFINIILGFVFYAIPIVYLLDQVDSELLRTIVQLNPLAYLITGARDLIIEGTIYYPERYLVVAIGAFVFFMLAWRIFYVSEDKVIERMI